MRKIYFFFVFLFFFALLFLFFFSFSKSSLPEYNGRIKSTLISTNVNIYIDNFGIPHIVASNDNDAAFALGFVHAQERLFQMDLMRRLAKGKLSEVFGEETLEFDLLFKTFDLNNAAYNEIKDLDENILKFLSSYINGVNFFIDNFKHKYPLEFSLLDYKPEKWSIIDIALISKLLAWQLNMSMWADVAFANIFRERGEEICRYLIPAISEQNVPIIKNQSLKFDKYHTAFIEVNKRLKEFLNYNGFQIGSNNWAVSSKKSLSGKPIIANDPHLPLQVPSFWFISNIYTNNFEISGVTIPGTPFIIVGTNKKIAWTVTNVMLDDCDFYVEILDSTFTKYKVDGTYRKLELKQDTIYVKNKTPRIIIIKKTHRGPILSDVHPYKILAKDIVLNRYALSMRWTALEKGGNIKAYYLINRASNWDEFKKALSYYSAPAQNFVYADSSGNIGYICGGALPQRRYLSKYSFYDGSKSEQDWITISSNEYNPILFNPESNFIATANNKVIDNEDFYIGNLWEPKNRAERINSLLKIKEKLTIEDFFSIQSDLYSSYPFEILRHLFEEIDKYEIKDEQIKTTLRILKNWDGNYDKNLQAPLIFEVFLNKLLRNIIYDELGETLFYEYVFITNIPLRTLPQILNDANCFLYDNINTAEKENKEKIIIQSFIETVNELTNKYGKDISNWQWKNESFINLRHFFAGKNLILDFFINIGKFPVGGSATTVSKGEYSLNDPYKIIVAPSFRFVYDFETPSKVYIILPTGQSGHFLSKNYGNMTELFFQNKYLIINFNESEAIKLENKFFIIKQD